MTSSRLLLFSAAAILLGMQGLRAAPLDAEECTKLNSERLQLEFGGVRINMTKGPDWAKTNLAAEALGQIRRLIDVDAQILFRCAGGGLVNLTPEPEPDPAAAAGEDDRDTPADKASSPARAKKPPDAAKKAAAPLGKGPDAKSAPAKKAPSTNTKQDNPRPTPGKAAAAKPKVHPKAKTDDAYRPPASDPNANPFGGQAAPAAK